MADLVLAIETSCDETAVALATCDGEILVSRIASQVDLHAAYGGVVPELASRNHNLDLKPLISNALEDAGVTWSQVRAVAATSGPGLASSLLIGDTTAKAIAIAIGKPFYSINHMEGHLFSPFIGRDPEETSFPHLALIVSGGHTLLIGVNGVGHYELIGTTRDDAAGEAFDKVGKLLGFPYPGGPVISSRSGKGNREAFSFPRSMIDSGDFAFSFSGLKTSARYLLEKLGEDRDEETIDDFCASFQEAIIDVLIAKLDAASKAKERSLFTISGGVSCNPRLRERAIELAEQNRRSLLLAEPSFSTDNAAMIAFAASLRIRNGIEASTLMSDIDPNLRLA
ncbi:MAG: tRNA (adenosine(37)-N6)-threonylcarbamoyltransferase complex transferase subunit TsaD [Verrucomicrobiota bacterium]